MCYECYSYDYNYSYLLKAKHTCVLSYIAIHTDIHTDSSDNIIYCIPLNGKH